MGGTPSRNRACCRQQIDYHRDNSSSTTGDAAVCNQEQSATRQAGENDMKNAEDPLEAYNRGIEYLDYNEPDQAQAAFNEAIRLRPEFVAAWFARGFAAANMGQFSRAIADFSRALELDPGYAAAYYNRGIAYRALGDEAQAQADASHYARLRAKAG